MRKLTQKGFTLVELLVVMGVFVTLFAVSTVALTGLIPKANVVTAHQTLLSDLKNQQLKAMVGDTNGSGDGSAYGVYLESDRYTLFVGPAYNPDSADNIEVLLSPGMSIQENTFPSSSIIFLENSGEVSGHDELNSSFKLVNSTGEEHLIDINKLGVVLPE